MTAYKSLTTINGETNEEICSAHIISSARPRSRPSDFLPHRASAYAQDPTPTPRRAQRPVESTALTERVVVTGSYIPTAETESPCRLVYTAEVLQKRAPTPGGRLRQLPSFVGTLDGKRFNGGNGTATINLRARVRKILDSINGAGLSASSTLTRSRSAPCRARKF